MAKYYFEKYSLKMDLPADPGSSGRVVGNYYLVNESQRYSSSTKTAYFSAMELSKPLQIGEMKSVSTGWVDPSTGNWNPSTPSNFITSEYFLEYNSNSVNKKFAKFISSFDVITPKKYDGTFIGFPRWSYINDVSQFEDILGKDEFIEYVIGEENEFPENGAQGEFWYVRGKKLFPSLKINGQTIGGAKIKDNTGQVRVVGNVYFKDSAGVVRNLK